MTIDNSLKSGSAPQISPSAAEIQAWLVTQLAKELEIAPDRIDVEQAIAAYGIDSMQAVTVIAGLEDWLGVRFKSNPLEEYPSIAALAGFAAEENDGSG